MARNRYTRTHILSKIPNGTNIQTPRLVRSIAQAESQEDSYFLTNGHQAILNKALQVMWQSGPLTFLHCFNCYNMKRKTNKKYL